MSLVIITGGLRGFGHFIAEAFRQDSSSPVDLILTSSQYQESDSQQQKEGADISGKDTASVERRVHLDFSTPLEQQRTRIETICTEIEKMTKKRPGGYERVILVNNAGTLGPLEHIDSMATHLTQLQAAVHLNITSLIFWTSSMVSFLTKQFGSGSLTVVNVSSLAALQPFDCWSVYCAGKAARDMWHRSLALEYPQVRALNYAPGPLDTDMQRQIREEMPDDSELKQQFRNLFQNDQLVKPLDSARRLHRLLMTDKFESGAHVDFYDVDDNDKILNNSK